MAGKGKAFTALESDKPIRTKSMGKVDHTQNVFGPKMTNNLELVENHSTNISHSIQQNKQFPGKDKNKSCLPIVICSAGSIPDSNVSMSPPQKVQSIVQGKSIF